tara:strand:- start:882 stop:1208 length:327 start_codon:yes stop_codon:yes gene_type:complete
MKKYEIEYKDCISMTCVVDIEALHEKEAIINLQQELIEEGDYMTELISIDENDCGCDDCDGEWKLEDGTELDQDSQDALNEAMSSYTNSNGVTLEEAIKRASERKNNK